MIKAVILDLDETLTMTEEVAFDMENEALKKMDREPMSRAIHKSSWGVPLKEAITKRSPGVDVKKFKDLHTQVLVEYIQSGKIDVFTQDNIQAIDRLIDAGKTIVILTSRDYFEVRHVLSPSNILASRVEAFYYKDNMRYHKPDPRAFEHIEAQHGWKPQECVYVGDTVSDAIAAKGAGLHFVASLESGLRTTQDFAVHDVDVFINAFPEVVGAIANIDKSLESQPAE